MTAQNDRDSGDIEVPGLACSALRVMRSYPLVFLRGLAARFGVEKVTTGFGSYTLAVVYC